MISPDIGVLCPREDVTLTCSTADENDWSGPMMESQLGHLLAVNSLVKH